MLPLTTGSLHVLFFLPGMLSILPHKPFLSRAPTLSSFRFQLSSPSTLQYTHTHTQMGISATTDTFSHPLYSFPSVMLTSPFPVLLCDGCPWSCNQVPSTDECTPSAESGALGHLLHQHSHACPLTLRLDNNEFAYHQIHHGCHYWVQPLPHSSCPM